MAGLEETRTTAACAALSATDPMLSGPCGAVSAAITVWLEADRVVAMWAAFAAALLAALRRPLRIKPRLWRLGHTVLVVLVVLGGVFHALLIDGTMGSVSKLVLCALVVAATTVALFNLRAWMVLARRKPQNWRP